MDGALKKDFDEDTVKHLRAKLRYACEEKQKTQTFDEQMAPYSQLIEKIKSKAPVPIYKVVNYQTREEYADFAASFALFEEYELIDRLIKEGAGGKYNTFNFLILNTNVRPEFMYFEPSPLYFITVKRAWVKMKDPKKMLEYLVKRGANINETAGDGSNALWNQIYPDGSPDVLQALLELGAYVNILDSENNTPLSLARKNNLSEIEELLLKHGALLPDEMEAPDDDGRYDAWS